MKERLHVKIEGSVQGVRFRELAKSKAEDLGLTGWIKNLDDGTVEAVFEGDPKKLQEMLEFCRLGPPDAVVDTIEEEWEDADEEVEEFHGFSIEY